MGLALMEEIQIVDGRITNPSFTDYLIPTILDTPPMPIEVLEYADPHAPYGLRGVGEAPPSRRTGRRRGDPGRHRSGPAPGPDPARGRDPHPMTRPRLTAADLAEVERILAPADAALARDYPGDPAERQPVHTVYVPADRGPGVLEQHGRRPRRPRRARPRPRARWPGGRRGPDQVAAVWPLLLRGSSASRSRTSGSTSRTATAATPTTRRTPRPAAAAPWRPTRRRTGRAVQVLRGAHPGPRAAHARPGARRRVWRRPAARRLPRAEVTSVEQVLAMAAACERLEAAYLDHGRLRFEVQVETPQAVLGADGTATVARLVHAARGGATACTSGPTTTPPRSGSPRPAGDGPPGRRPRQGRCRPPPAPASRSATARPTCCRSARPSRSTRRGRCTSGCTPLARAWPVPGLGPAPRPAAHPVPGDVPVLPVRPRAGGGTGARSSGASGCSTSPPRCAR